MVGGKGFGEGTRSKGNMPNGGKVNWGVKGLGGGPLTFQGIRLRKKGSNSEGILYASEGTALKRAPFGEDGGHWKSTPASGKGNDCEGMRGREKVV